VNDVTSL